MLVPLRLHCYILVSLSIIVTMHDHCMVFSSAICRVICEGSPLGAILAGSFALTDALKVVAHTDDLR